MKKTLNIFLGIMALMVLTRCKKQELSQSVIPITADANKLSGITSYPSYNTSPQSPDQTGMASTAAQLASHITLGYNIGNTMEAINGEQGWGNPLITQALIDKVKASGFNAIRIPCEFNWSKVINQSTAQIDPAWLARVQTVVQYCVNDGMYVVLNIHSDGGWLQDSCTTAAQAAVNAKQKAFWEQIATQLRGFDEHLMFASANEPHVNDATAMSILLSYHQTFINAVRSTGGHNSYRTLVIQGPNTDITQTNNLMNTMPTDQVANKLMVEVHYYTPVNFCLQNFDYTNNPMYYYWGSGYHTTFDVKHNSLYGEESDENTWFGQMKTKFVDHGIPVVLGEFGAWRRGISGDSLKYNAASVAYWNNYLVHNALNNGILPFLWDTGSIINRSNYSVQDQQQLTSLVQGTQNGSSQTFQVGGVYQILNRFSFKPLEIWGWGTANGSTADQWDYAAGQNQQFKVVNGSNGHYLLIPMHAQSRCLEVLNWSGSNGGTVDIWDYSGTGGNNQNWSIQATDNGYYKIINVNSGKALEVYSPSTTTSLTNGTAVDQWDYTGAKFQQWAFVKVN